MTTCKRKRDEFVTLSRSFVTCGICTDVIHAPKHLSCPCESSFCETCLKPWLEKSDKCPGCNTKLKDLTMSDSGRQLRQALDAIKRPCPNSSECRFRRNGYAETCAHARNECAFRTLPCPNEGCGQIVVQKCMRDHLRLCRLKHCKNFRPPKYGCNVMGTQEFVRQHELKCSFTHEVLKQIDDLMLLKT